MEKVSSFNSEKKEGGIALMKLLSNLSIFRFLKWDKVLGISENLLIDKSKECKA